MSDWDDSGDEATTKTTAPAAATIKVPLNKAKKWEGEDEEDDGPVVCLLLSAIQPSHMLINPSLRVIGKTLNLKKRNPQPQFPTPHPRRKRAP